MVLGEGPMLHHVALAAIVAEGGIGGDHPLALGFDLDGERLGFRFGHGPPHFVGMKKPPWRGRLVDFKRAFYFWRLTSS